MNNKKTLVLIFATIVTLVLAVVAVATSMRLKQLSTVPVAPNAPVSQPKAAGEACDFSTACAQGETCVNGICQADANSCSVANPCPSGEVCQNGACVRSGGGGAGSIACEVAFNVTQLVCGDTCTSSPQCGTGLSCEGTPRVCTLPACSGKSNPCNCPGPVSCVSKEAFRDSANNKPGEYQFTDPLAANSVVARGQNIVYRINYSNGTGTGTTNIGIADVLPAGLDLVDRQTGCVYEPASRTVRCTIDTSTATSTTGFVAFRAVVNATATAGALNNHATVIKGTETDTCDIALTVGVTTSPTPSPSPSPTPEITPTPTPEITPTPTPPLPPVCNDACEADEDCPDDLVCSSGRCRNDVCAGEADCTCPPVCNSYCANDGECPSNLKCLWNKCRNNSCGDDTDCVCTVNPGCNETCTVGGAECAGGYVCDSSSLKCRNSQCVSEADCQCAVVPPPTPSATVRPASTPTPAPEVLPTAGSILPTVIFIGIGGILAILGMVLVGL